MTISRKSLLFFIFSVVVFVAAVFSWFLLPRNSAIPVHFSSANSNRKVILANQRALEMWLTRLGYDKQNTPVTVVLGGASKNVVIDRILVNFSDVEQPAYHVLNGTEVILSAGFEYSENDKKLTITINSNSGSQAYAQTYEYATLDILARISAAHPVDEMNADEVWRAEYGTQKLKNRFLVAVPNVFSMIVKPVFAQSCSGNFQCGTYQGVCSGGGGSCSNLGQTCVSNGQGGICNNTCVAQGGSTSCSAPAGDPSSYQNMCQNYPVYHCTSPGDLSKCKVSGSCGFSSCPSGQYFCGGQGTCGAGCRNTGGLTCQQWLDANCNAPVPTPTPPPGCGNCNGSCACGTSCNGQCSISGASCGLTGSPCPTGNPVPDASCTGVTIGSCVNKDGTFAARANGVQNADEVLFYTWSITSSCGGNNTCDQGDIVWYSGTNVGGGTWQTTIPENTHRGGYLTTHVWMNQSGDPDRFCAGALTFIPCTWTVQGRKQEWNGSAYVSTAMTNALTTTLSNGTTTSSNPTTADPFTFDGLLMDQDPTITVQRPAGCSVGYTLCYSDFNCHTTTPGTVPTSGNGFSCGANSCSINLFENSATGNFDVNTDPYAYASVYFHFNCPAATCTGISPANSSTTTISATNQTFTISGVSAGATGVSLQVRNSSGTVLGTLPATVTADPTIYTAQLPLNDTTYFIDPLTVQALVSSTSTANNPSCSTTFGRKVNLTGRIYNTNGAATSTNGQGICSAPLPAAQFSPTGGTTCSYSGGGSCVVSGANVTVTNASLTSAARILSLTADTGTYSYACPANGQQSASPTNFATQYNFYLTQNAGGWYQLVGGNARAESSSSSNAPAIQSIIPDTCGGCTLSRKAVAGATGTATSGYMVVGAGSTAISAAGAASSSKLNEEGNNGYAQGTNSAGQQNYAYFYNLYDLGTNPTAPISTNNLTLASLDVNNATYVASRAYYVRPSSGNTVTIAAGMAVPAGRSIVVFVNGDLVISGATPITVSNNGGFLAFIVNGSITFANDVGTATMNSETPTIEGVYIANSTLTIASTSNIATEKKFVGAGTFAGFGGINLNRTLGVTNNTTPAELFVVRPDFAQHAPTELKRAIYDWQEVEP